MEREQIRAFLYRVATDPTYRALLESDPVDTLTEAGFTVDPGDVPQGGIHLPSNDEILAKLEELTDQLQALCLSVIHHFMWR